MQGVADILWEREEMLQQLLGETAFSDTLGELLTESTVAHFTRPAMQCLVKKIENQLL